MHPPFSLLCFFFCSADQKFKLSENKITDLPVKAVRHLKKLETLNLMKNRLYELPEAIGNVDGLKTLILDMNRLDLLPPAFQKLRRLEHFSAAMNRIHTLPESIGKLANLRYLSLEGNQLCRLPPGLGQLRLEELRVSHNRLGESIYLSAKKRTLVRLA